ncbi:MAG: T9SS type A sorting domain-containing protein, partial [bacterium]
AKLTDRVVSDTLDVNYTVTKPQIDGNSDEAWADVPLISHNTYVTDDSQWDIKLLNDWKDLQFDYQVMWDDDYFYALIQVIDDRKYNQQTNPWDNDGVELYFDGDNSKTESGFDENDDRLIFVCKGSLTSVHSHIDTSNIECAFALKGDGWSLELAIPFANLKFNPTVDHQFGFEIQINDNDGGETRENMARWWSNTIELEQNPGLFGTAQLIKVAETDVENRKSYSMMDDYDLAQNYPNPFNAETAICYQLPNSCQVTLRIMNILGQEIVQLVDKQQQSGHYVISWNASQLSSGVYFYELTAQSDNSVKFSKINKMLLMK